MTPPLSPDLIDELDALLKVASAQPWRASPTGGVYMADGPMILHGDFSDGSWRPNRLVNEKLAVAAVNAAPSLLASARRNMETVAMLEKSIAITKDARLRGLLERILAALSSGGSDGR